MQAMTHEELDADLALLRAAAVSAGIMAMGYFRRDIKTWTKENASPVSEADMLVDEFLGETLLAARPEYGWLSEETADDPDRLQRDRVFIVDPIDGTRGFLRGDDAWTVALSVVEAGRPKVGVVYAPARDELFEARAGGGALLNSAPLITRHHHGDKVVIPAPSAVLKHLGDLGVDYVHGPALPSLAYRLLQVATGVYDLALARRGAQDWDIAASDIILEECGITLEDVCSGPPQYNRENLRHGALAATRDSSLRSKAHLALRSVYGCPDESDTQKD
ncbi:MAG: 3'(2'),5'-bisphosphate nucleotidase CysQ [Hyphomicrobiaceae bacterium]|nr:3'(2'),5'-bisphosphate nucleotidase CysQ [Hyphomicrobiaceae bacterium]MCC0023012.1 3'(2'),5'-bisphosphate nucleotidase CysQ [Hyphomicrobiaceae bacterium]